jgi:hypothetical protein
MGGYDQFSSLLFYVLQIIYVSYVHLCCFVCSHRIIQTILSYHIMIFLMPFHTIKIPYLFVFNCSVSLYAYYMIYMIHMFYVLMIHIVMDIFDIMISLINHLLLGECPCVTTGTYNNIITYIQNVSYIVIGKCFIIHL